MEKIYKQLSIEERVMIQTQLSMWIKPVQIAREQVSHETIYTASMRCREASCTRGEDRRVRYPDRVSIHDRPAEIEERPAPGHWEGDLIKGTHNRSSVGTLVERTTLFTVLAKMGDAGAASAVESFGFALNRIEAQKRLSMTCDRGKEMAGHQVDKGIKVFFADPHSPWQRGINEKTNGLVRQYLPKGSDLGVFSQKELDAIAWKLNTCPRKSLGFKSPAQLFTSDAFDFRQHHAALFALSA